MIALAGMGSDFHFAEEGVHFGDRQDAPCPYRTVAGHCSGDGVDAFFQGEGFTEGGEFIGEVGDETADIGLTQHRGDTADQHSTGAEAFEVEAEFQEFRGAGFEAVAGGFVEFYDFGQQQRLHRYAAVFRRFSHPFQDKAFVGGVLIDYDETVLGFGDDIGSGDLASGDSHWV